MRRFAVFIGLALLLASASPGWAQGDSAAYQADHDQWVQRRLAWLFKPDGYLSLIGLHWLSDTPQTIPGIGQATLDGRDVVLELEPGWTVDGQPQQSYRVTPEQASKIKFHKDTVHFYVNHHGQRINLRVKDSQAPMLTSFSPPERFPLDEKWRIMARFERDQAAIPVTSVVDEVIDESSPGYAVFEWEGQTHKLRLMGEESDEDYFLVFSDESAGITTYEACRFLEVEKADDGSLILDFNRAWNPPCSMTPYATCPLPPKGNILPFEVNAGEQYNKVAAH
jgi:uncharacterized protein (DUF1684 family)